MAGDSPPESVAGSPVGLRVAADASGDEGHDHVVYRGSGGILRHAREGEREEGENERPMNV